MVKIIKAKISEHEEDRNYILKKYKYDDSDFANLEYDILEKFENKCQLILVGQVQSGKTKNIISIIKKAINKFNYDLIIYFSGITNDLNNQTYNRLSKEITNVITTKDLNQNILSSLVIVSLKQSDNIRKIEEFILNNKSKFKKILIIDDESDYGSINSKDIEDDEASIVYELIYKNIYKMCKNSGGVLKLTATPFVNILTKKEKFKKDSPYIYSLPTNKNYTGVSYFNSLNEKFWVSTSSNINNSNSKINDYKCDIIASFFVWIYKSYLLYLDKEIENKKSELLINISMNNADHQSIQNIITEFAYNDLSKFKFTLKKVIDDKLNIVVDNELEEQIYKFYKNVVLEKLTITIFNQENCKKEDQSDYKIYIGGILLSRGKTFENLICELITIDNQFNYDNLLQKCRWFGYRLNRSKYMSLICNKAIKRQLEDVEKIINIFHKDNLGYELSYEKVLLVLNNLKHKLLDNAKFTPRAKI